MNRVLASEDLDCFMELREFRICEATHQLSNCFTLTLLMVQAVLSRIIFPGTSNFVNASVRRLPATASVIVHLAHSQQVLHTSPSDCNNERSTLDICDNDDVENSEQVTSGTSSADTSSVGQRLQNAVQMSSQSGSTTRFW